MTEAQLQQQEDPRYLEYLRQRQLAAQDNLIKFQLDNSDELELLRIDLLGLKYDPNGDLVKDENREPLMNERGVNMVVSFLRPRITKIVSLSNLDDEDIRNRCKSYMDTLTYLLVRHMGEFEIHSLQILDNIIELCDDIFFVTMMKAFDAGERDTIRKTFTHVESKERITDNRTDKPSLFVNPFAGGGNK